jgi:uncharacterized protein (UPF0332 family)
LHNAERITLSKYRTERAYESIADAKVLFEHNSYRSCNNRVYYAIFDAVRAVLALDGIDYKKHSGVIQYFQKEYIKKELFPREFSKTISFASIIRNASDYEDFYIATKEEALHQLNESEKFIEAIIAYLTPIWDE